MMELEMFKMFKCSRSVESEIRKAIYENNLTKVKALLNKGMDPNLFIDRCSILQKCLINTPPRIQILLLLLESLREKDKVPNLQYEIPVDNALKAINFLQLEIDGGHLDECCVLVFYGANPLNLNYTKAPNFKKHLEEIYKDYEQRKALEVQLKEPKTCYAAALELKNLWEKQAMLTKNDDFHQHFSQLAQHYATKADEHYPLESEPINSRPNAHLLTYNMRPSHSGNIFQ